MRAFVQLREILSTHKDLKRKLLALEKKYDEQFQLVFEAIRALMKEEEKPERKIGFQVEEPSPAKTIRKKLKLSQSAFASLMGVSPRTIQDWEQGRRTPQGPAKSLLRIAEQHPEIFLEVR